MSECNNRVVISGYYLTNSEVRFIIKNSINLKSLFRLFVKWKVLNKTFTHYFSREFATRAGRFNSCEGCGSTNNLTVHHIKPVKSVFSEQKIFDLTNFSILCRKCHIEKEKHLIKNKKVKK